jgi:hypothetical protein
MTAWWKVLGQPVLTPEVQKKLIDSVRAEVGSRSVDELAADETSSCLGFLSYASTLRKRVWRPNKRLVSANEGLKFIRAPSSVLRPCSDVQGQSISAMPDHTEPRENVPAADVSREAGSSGENGHSISAE